MVDARAGLPRRLIGRLTRPAIRFLRIEATAGAVLLLATLVTLGVSNSPLQATYEAVWNIEIGLQVGSFDYARSARDWINDALMTLFFFLVAIELKRELVLGELRAPRTAALSIAAATGGMLVPAGIYLLLQAGQSGAHGWGTVMATDTAFVIACLALLGARVPHSLRVFMLSLAIVDDIGAVLVVAIGYTSDIRWEVLGLGGLGCGAVVAISSLGVRSFAAYFTVGACTWIAVDASGIHGTVTGVILGLLTPARRWVSDHRLYAILAQVVAHPSADRGSGATRDRETLQAAEIAARESLSPVERLEIALHPWVAFAIVPLFALANAGLPLSLNDVEWSVSTAIVAAFVLGKPIGIIAFSWLAVRSGIAVRPIDLDWPRIVGAGLLAGIGFTMALFIAELAFGSELLDSAKLGIFLASAVAASSGLVVLLSSSRRRR